MFIGGGVGDARGRGARRLPVLLALFFGFFAGCGGSPPRAFCFVDAPLLKIFKKEIPDFEIFVFQGKRFCKTFLENLLALCPLLKKFFEKIFGIA